MCAFERSTLRILKFSKNICKIEDYAFYASKLSYVVFDFKQNLEIGRNAFSYCGINQLIISNNVKCNYSSFSNANIGMVLIEEGVNKLFSEQFFGSSIKSIRLPTSVNSVPFNCFSECKNLKRILIPKEVTYIAYNAFSYTETKYVKKSDGTPDMRYNPIRSQKELDLTIYCEAGSSAQQYARENGFKCCPSNEYYD